MQHKGVNIFVIILSTLVLMQPTAVLYRLLAPPAQLPLAPPAGLLLVPPALAERLAWV